MGGASTTESSIPLTMSLKNIHIVCCKQSLKANLILMCNEEKDKTKGSVRNKHDILC